LVMGIVEEQDSKKE
jgi:hypothetical protein